LHLKTPLESTDLPPKYHAVALFRYFKLAFVPLLIFSFLGQAAVVWTQLDDIKAGHFDFVLYYSAAQIIRDGKRDQLYELNLQRDYQKDFGVAYLKRALPFNHPPYELLIFLPLANYSFPVAHVLWAVINLLLLFWILYRLALFIDFKHQALFGLMLFAYFPTLTALKMGQDSIVTSCLWVETFVNLKRRRYMLAGSILALGLYKPQFVLPLAGILLVQRCWPAIMGFLTMATLLAATSLAMVGGSGLLSLLSMWLPMTERGQVVWPELMVNLRGLVYLTLNLAGVASATNLMNMFLSAIIYLVALRLWLVSSNDGGKMFNLRFALAVTTTALVSYHLYSYDAMLLIIPFILMLDHLFKGLDRSAIMRPALMALLIVSFLPLLPNVLLSTAVLAWWALPIPILYALIAAEIFKRENWAPKPAELKPMVNAAV